MAHSWQTSAEGWNRSCVVGAGFDYKLSDRLSLGMEGLYYGFDGEDSKKLATSFSGDEGGDHSRAPVLSLAKGARAVEVI